MKLVHLLDIIRPETLCPVRESIFVYRIRGEVHYMESLRAITTEKLEARREASCVDPDYWVWKRGQFQLEFRLWRKRGQY